MRFAPLYVTVNPVPLVKPPWIYKWVFLAEQVVLYSFLEWWLQASPQRSRGFGFAVNLSTQEACWLRQFWTVYLSACGMLALLRIIPVHLSPLLTCSLRQHQSSIPVKVPLSSQVTVACPILSSMVFSLPILSLKAILKIHLRKYGMVIVSFQNCQNYVLLHLRRTYLQAFFVDCRWGPLLQYLGWLPLPLILHQIYSRN